jgi:hypothetical protein
LATSSGGGLSSGQPGRDQAAQANERQLADPMRDSTPAQPWRFRQPQERTHSPTNTFRFSKLTMETGSSRKVSRLAARSAWAARRVDLEFNEVCRMLAGGRAVDLPGEAVTYRFHAEWLLSRPFSIPYLHGGGGNRGSVRLGWVREIAQRAAGGAMVDTRIYFVGL